MRMTTPLLGAAIGGGIGFLKRDPAKYALWGAGIGLLVTLLGGASVSVGGISIRVGFDDPEAVGEVQMMLKQLGYVVDMDGYLGPKTVAALKAVQSKCGLQPDGKLSGQTIACLTRLANSPSVPIPVTSGDFAGADVPWWAPLSPVPYAISRAAPAVARAAPDMPWWAPLSPVTYAEKLSESSFR